MRKIVGILRAGPYLGHKSPSTTYNLVHSDPEFAAIWHKTAGGMVQTFEDLLEGYAENRAKKAPAYPPDRQPQPSRNPLGNPGGRGARKYVPTGNPVGRPPKRPEDQDAAPHE